MNLKFIEKLSYSIIIFIGVCIMTAYTIGFYVKTKNQDNNLSKVGGSSILLENINYF